MTLALSRLEALVSAVAEQVGAGTLPDPPFVREQDTPLDVWLESVATARQAHDAFALLRQRARDVLTGASASLAAELSLPAGDDLVRSSRSFAVQTGTQLVDVVPELGAQAPQGPTPASPEATETVRLRIVGPRRASGAGVPCILRLHGGAFWMGGGVASEVLDRDLTRYLVHRTGAVVIDVDYRLAPEHPFPAPIVDALLALDLVREHAVALGIDPARIALLGTSSGGNTATLAAVADAARTSAAPLAALCLVVPSVNLTTGPAALRDDPLAWAARVRQIGAYIGDALPLDSPWVSPALVDRLPGMPPTLAIVAEHDEVAQGGEALCAAIVAGGGTAAVRRYPMTHTTCLPDVEAESVRDLAEFLAEALGVA